MTVSYDFDGRVVLVTGGSHGIGRAIVEALAGYGARVHFTYRTRHEAASQIEAMPSRYPVRAHPLDVRRPSEVDAFVTAVAKEEGRLDGLVNNAAITSDLLLGEMDDEAFDSVIATNLLGPFHLVRAAGSAMIRCRKGAIVNVSSVVGEHPEAGQSNYAASKGGLNALTRSLALELGPKGIRVNAVAPGIVPTSSHTTSKNARLLREGILDGIPLRRFGEMSEVAAAVVWLLSDESSYVTGALLAVSGGYKA